MLNSRKTRAQHNPKRMQCKSTLKFKCQFSNEEYPGVILSVPQETSGCKCFKNNFHFTKIRAQSKEYFDIIGNFKAI